MADLRIFLAERVSLSSLFGSNIWIKCLGTADGMKDLCFLLRGLRNEA